MYKPTLKKPLKYLLRIKRSLLPNFHFASLPAFGGLFQSIPSILKCNFIENVQDSKMYLDEHDTPNLSLNRIYEPFETICFQKQIRIGLLRSGVEPKVYLKLLMEMGFTIYHIDENEQRI